LAKTGNAYKKIIIIIHKICDIKLRRRRVIRGFTVDAVTGTEKLKGKKIKYILSSGPYIRDKRAPNRIPPPRYTYRRNANRIQILPSARASESSTIKSRRLCDFVVCIRFIILFVSELTPTSFVKFIYTVGVRNVECSSADPSADVFIKNKNKNYYFSTRII